MIECFGISLDWIILQIQKLDHSPKDKLSQRSRTLIPSGLSSPTARASARSSSPKSRPRLSSLYHTKKFILFFFLGQLPSPTSIQLHPVNWRLAAVPRSNRGRISYFSNFPSLKHINFYPILCFSTINAQIPLRIVNLTESNPKNERKAKISTSSVDPMVSVHTKGNTKILPLLAFSQIFPEI